MRTYYIYLIEKEFAEYFYGRESKFYELFAADRYAMGEFKEIVQRQIHFITKSLPYLEIHKLLSQSVQKKRIQISGKVYCTPYKTQEGGAELTIGERCLELKAWGGFEAESVFFEELRKFDGRFLAVDIDHKRYGWIRPVKERKYILNK